MNISYREYSNIRYLYVLCNLLRYGLVLACFLLTLFFTASFDWKYWMEAGLLFILYYIHKFILKLDRLLDEKEEEKLLS